MKIYKKRKDQEMETLQLYLGNLKKKIEKESVK